MELMSIKQFADAHGLHPMTLRCRLNVMGIKPAATTPAKRRPTALYTLHDLNRPLIAYENRNTSNFDRDTLVTVAIYASEIGKTRLAVRKRIYVKDLQPCGSTWESTRRPSFLYKRCELDQAMKAQMGRPRKEATCKTKDQ